MSEENRGTLPDKPLRPPLAGRSIIDRLKKGWLLIVGVALLALAAGLFLGTLLPDPTASQQYRDSVSERDRLVDRGRILQGSFDDLRSKYEDLDLKYTSLEAGMKQREEAVASLQASVAEAESKVKAAEAAVKKREEAVTAAEKTKEQRTIREGTWTVGVDIEPGTYRTTAEVVGACYWGIYRTGSNGADIIDNDIVSGGRPSVTLSAGQDFETSRCGSWLKQ